MKRISLLLWALLAWVLPAGAQQEAQAKLYSRVEGDVVRAAIQIRVTSGWHLYHTELGGPEAVGKPLTVSFTGADVEWEPVRTTEPTRHDDPDEPDGWTWIHKGKVMVFALGRLAEGADASGLEAALTGLTCTDAGVCIPYKETVRTQGDGSDRYFKDFPEGWELAAPPAEAGMVSGGPGRVDSPGLGGATLAAPGASQDMPLETPPGLGGGGDIFGFQKAPKKKAEGGMHDALPLGPDDYVAAKLYSRVEDDVARLAIVVEVRDGFHLYHGPTAEDMAPIVDGERVEIAVGEPTTFDLPAGFDWQVHYPEAEVYENGFGRDSFEVVPVLVHEGQMLFRAQAELDGKALDEVSGALIGQACDDSSCYNVEIELASAGAGPDALFADFPAIASPGQGAGASSSGAESAGASATSAAAGGTEDLGQKSLGSFLLLAVFWGLITLLMPCTYPMIPITISFFTKQAIAREGKVWPLSLTYGIGIVAIFVLIGVVLGPPIIAFATHPVTNLVIGALFIFFAFVLFGAINLQPPAFLMNAAGKASSTGGVLGVFLMGATLVITSFTCTAPFVGSLLSFGATGAGDGAMLRIILGMGVFGLTMATPFVFLSLVPGKMQKMPQAGEWMHVLKVFLGFVELAAALKFISNADVVWGWGILSREIFLMLWFGILLVAALFLFGWIKLEGEDAEHIGPLRMVGGVFTLLASLYSGMGVMGYQLDDIMTAIIPPYSSERIGGFSSGGEKPASHQIIEDDYDRARELAVDESKLLLVNFTGHT